MKTSWLKSVLLCAACGIITGCATSFQSGSLNEVSGYPDVFRKQSIYADLAFAGRLNGEPWPLRNEQNQTYLEKRLVQELENSGMFSAVSAELKTTDLQLRVAVINEKEKSTSGMTLSALTLFLYPYTETDAFQLMAKTVDRSSGKETVIRLNDEIKTRQQLFLGLLAPFKSSPAGELEACTDRLIRNLVLELHKTGVVK